MDLLNSPALLAGVFAFFFWRAGDYEARQGGRNFGVLWAVISVVVSVIVLVPLQGTWGVLLVAQVLLFFGIGAFRAWREP